MTVTFPNSEQGSVVLHEDLNQAIQTFPEDVRGAFYAKIQQVGQQRAYYIGRGQDVVTNQINGRREIHTYFLLSTPISELSTPIPHGIRLPNLHHPLYTKITMEPEVRELEGVDAPILQGANESSKVVNIMSVIAEKVKELFWGFLVVLQGIFHCINDSIAKKNL